MSKTFLQQDLQDTNKIHMKSKSNAMLELNGVENAIYRYGTFNLKQVVKT